MKSFTKVLFLGLFFAIAPVNAKILNISTNPLGFAFDAANVAVDVALGKKLTLGAEYAIIDADEGFITEEGSGFGGRVAYWFNEAFQDSWWIRGFYGSIETDLTIDFLGLSTTTYVADGSYLGVMAGYGWFWSVFNIGLGVGYVQYDLDTTATATVNGQTVESPVDGGGLGIEFTIGVAF